MRRVWKVFGPGRWTCRTQATLVGACLGTDSKCVVVVVEEEEENQRVMVEFQVEQRDRNGCGKDRFR